MPWKCSNTDGNISLSVTEGQGISENNTVSRKVTTSYFSTYSAVFVRMSFVLVKVVLGTLSSAVSPGMRFLYGQSISPEY